MTMLYRFYDATDRLLYVGITDRGPRRWREHQRDKPWWPDVARVELEQHPDRPAALEAESVAITTEHPAHNIAGAQRSTKPPRSSKVTKKTEYRADLAEDAEWDVNSLVGSWFHADYERAWQGNVVAKLTDTHYLVQTYSYLMGEPHSQRVVTLADMTEWQFYDDNDDMRYAYKYGGVQARWDRKRAHDESVKPF